MNLNARHTGIDLYYIYDRFSFVFVCGEKKKIIQYMEFINILQTRIK